MGLLSRAKKIRKKRRNKYLRKQKFSSLKIFLLFLKRIILIIDISLLILIFLFIFSTYLVDEGIINKDKYIEVIRYIVEFFR